MSPLDFSDPKDRRRGAGNKGIAITEGEEVCFDICRVNIHSKIKS